MMRFFSLAFCLTICLTSYVLANLRDEVASLQKQLVAEENRYWKLKEDQLTQRKALNEELSLIEQETKGLYVQKNNLTEEIFLVKENSKNARELLLANEEKRQTLKSRVAELIEESGKKGSGLFPSILTDALNKRAPLTTGNPQSQVEGYFSYLNWLLEGSQEMVIATSTLILPPENIKAEGQSLRVGFIHESFTSDKGEALLIRETDIRGIRYAWHGNLPREIRQWIKRSSAAALKGSRIILPFDVTQSGKRLRSIREREAGNWIRQAWEGFLSGGPLMIPLLILAFVSLGIIVERFRYFRKTLKALNDFEPRYFSLLEKREKSPLLALTQSHAFYLSKILSSFFEDEKINREQAENKLNENLQRYTPHWEKKLSLLAVLGSIAPLMGLLGTVVGMIDLFDVITLYGTNNPKQLAGGISVALVTTQTGLTIAIPVLLFHHYLVGKKKWLEGKIETMALQALNRFFPETS